MTLAFGIFTEDQPDSYKFDMPSHPIRRHWLVNEHEAENRFAKRYLLASIDESCACCSCCMQAEEVIVLRKQYPLFLQGLG